MTSGFFASMTSGFIPSIHSYLTFSDTSMTGAWNSGMLNTATGIATVPESGLYNLSVAANVENNGYYGKSYIADLIVEINGVASRLRSQQTITNNDTNTLKISGVVNLTAGQNIRVKLVLSEFKPNQMILHGYFGTYFSMCKIG